MAIINQQPAALAITGVAGNPFDLLITFTSVTVTATGASVSWNSASVANVVMTDQYGNSLSSLPAITAPQNFELLIAWSAAQTAAISNSQSPLWALELTIGGFGPTAVLAGPLVFTPATFPVATANTTTNLSVIVGLNTVNMTATLG